jgi:hypothetical protein
MKVEADVMDYVIRNTDQNKFAQVLSRAYGVLNQRFEIRHLCTWICDLKADKIAN